MSLSLFHRLKLFNHSSTTLRIQYKMIAMIEEMIFQFFYDDILEHEININNKQKSLSQILIKYNLIRYNVDQSLLLFDILEVIKKDNIHFIYNVINVVTELNLFVNFVNFKIIEFKNVVIFIFYQTQLKVYLAALKILIFDHFNLKNVNIKTMNNMQKK